MAKVPVRARIPTEYLLLTGAQAAFMRASLWQNGQMVPNTQRQPPIVYPSTLVEFGDQENEGYSLKYQAVDSVSLPVGPSYEVYGVQPHLVAAPQE